MKRLIFLLLIVLFSSFLYGCGNKTSTGNEESSTPVQAMKVTNGDMKVNYDTSGQVKAATEVTIAPKVSGRVDQVNVKLGDQVRAGQVLFHIDDTEACNDATKASNDVITARNDLVKAEASLGECKTTYNTDLQTLSDAQTNYDRYQKLYESNAVSKSDFELAKTKLVNAQLSLEQAQQQINEANASISTANASLSTANASLSTAQDTVNDYSVTAPVDGIIGSIGVEIGEMVSSQTDAASLVSIGSVKVEASIPESVVNNLQLGSTVKVNIDSLNKSFEGTLTAIAPKADSTTMGYPIEITIANPSGEIKPGMSAKVNLVTGNLAHVIALPIDGVIEQNGQDYVYVVEKNKAKKVSVETGITNDTEIEITKGLTEGQNVIIQGNSLISDGQQVRVVAGKDGSVK